MQVIHNADHSFYRTSARAEMAFVPPELVDETLRQIATTSGCFTYNMTPAMADMFNKQRGVDAYRPGHTVVLLDEFVEGLTEEEISGIYYHELGHIRLGHIDRVEGGDVLTEDGIINDVALEFQADTYAASKVGNGVLRNGITKVIHNTAVFITELEKAAALGVTVEEVLAKFYQDEGLNARLEALR